MTTGYRPELIQRAFVDFISTRLHPFWSLTVPKLRLIARRTLNDDLIALQFEPNRPFEQQIFSSIDNSNDGWHGGQHINLSVLLDDIYHQRSYSLIGLPQQPLIILALCFEWAVAFHDIQISVDEYADVPKLTDIIQPQARALFGKIARQVGKNYIAFPTVVGLTLGRGSALKTLSGNITANIARNLWTWAVIFCAHFTEQPHMYTHLDTNESKGDWYIRQILSSSNIQSNKWLHILTGNLSHQIEHHIFADMPAKHYAKIAPTVQAICSKYHLAYNTGRFSQQFMQVLGRIHHFSKPSAEEWHAYTQSLANNYSNADKGNNNFASNSTAETVRGFKRFLPQVVRQMLYSWHFIGDERLYMIAVAFLNLSRSSKVESIK